MVLPVSPRCLRSVTVLVVPFQPTERRFVFISAGLRLRLQSDVSCLSIKYAGLLCDDGVSVDGYLI